MNKIKNWMIEHRTKIGYTVGIANILSGIINLAMGNAVIGVFWCAIGAVIFLDVKTYQ